MAQAGRVVWDLDLNDQGFNQKLKNASQDIQSLSRTANKSGDEIEGVFSRQATSFKALAASIGGATIALGSLIKSSITASVEMENALVGLSSVATSFRVNVGDANTAARSLAQDGLLSVKDASQGLQNLLATGFSLPEAINLMNSFRDAAAFNRQGTLGFGEAIVGATQGIKNQNSVLVDNVGISRNLSRILQDQGLTVDDLQDVTSDASVRQKLYNGLLQEASVFSGNAAKASETLGGKQAQLNTAFFNLKVQVGDVLKVGLVPLIDKLKEAITLNPQVATSLTIATAAAVAFAGTIVSLAGAVALALAIMGGPLTIVLIALAALFGKVVFGAVQDLQKKMAETSRGFVTDTKDMGDGADKNLGGRATKAAKELAKKLAGIDKQIKKSKETFQEQLAELVRSTRDRIKQLNKELSDENTQFELGDRNRTKSFEQANADAVKDHQRRVSDIEAQIQEENETAQKSHADRLAAAQAAYTAERAKGRLANRTRLAELLAALRQEQSATVQADADKLADLQLRLDRENEDFAEQQKRRKEEYDADVAQAKAAHDQKVLDTQTELQQQKDLLERHSADVLQVRDFQYRDEFQKLRESHEEQLKEFEQQKLDAIESARQTTTGMAAQFNSLPNQINNGIFSALGDNVGSEIASSLKESLLREVKELPRELYDQFSYGLRNIVGVISPFNIGGNGKDLDNFLGGLMRTFSNSIGIPIPQRAFGGSVSQGSPYLVGERGPELFVPGANGSIVPDISGLSSQSKPGSEARNVYVTLNAGGLVARSRQELRSITKDMLQSIDEELRSKGEKPLLSNGLRKRYG